MVHCQRASWRSKRESNIFHVRSYYNHCYSYHSLGKNPLLWISMTTEMQQPHMCSILAGHRMFPQPGWVAHLQLPRKHQLVVGIATFYHSLPSRSGVSGVFLCVFFFNKLCKHVDVVVVVQMFNHQLLCRCSTKPFSHQFGVPESVSERQQVRRTENLNAKVPNTQF